MDEKKQIDCIHYDAELDCCKVLSDWIDPMPVLVPCVESPCKFYEFGNSEIREMARIISEPECNDETGAIEVFAAERARAIYAAGYRKQSVGEWKTVDETNNHKVVECTNCKEQFYFAKNGQLQIDIMPHCPNCGAQMKGGVNHADA